VLSNGLPWLETDGRAIVNADTRQEILLRGVNRSGLEYAEPGVAGFLESAAISESEIDHIVCGWRTNVIRLPFNQDWALNGRGGFTAAAYLEAIDQIVFWTSRGGAYTLLDLQWIDADVGRGTNADGSCNRVPALPNAESIDVWALLADRYRSEPAVLFDIFNEPHDPLPDDLTPLEAIDDEGHFYTLLNRQVTTREWQPWARHLIRAIRRQHQRSLIFVPGVSWAYDLRGMPLTIPEFSSQDFENLVYTTHVYPWCGPSRVSKRLRWRLSRPAPSWKQAFGSLSRVAPVFIGEWGGGPQDVAWGEALARYARWLGIGWTAWSWSDWPRLVIDAQTQRYDETDFGRLVRRELQRAE
jgi:hypothetical protein